MQSLSSLDSDLSKLQEAIDVVANNQLKENCDDTLVEKLYTHLSSFISTCSIDAETTLLKQITNLLDESKPNAVTLRLLAIVISHPACMCDTVHTDTEVALTKFAMAAATVTPSSDLSLQSSLIRGLKKMSDRDWIVTGSLYSLPPVPFPKIIHSLMTRSPSYFVRHEAEDLLADICCHQNQNLMNNSEGIRPLVTLLQEVFTTPSVENLQFLKALLDKASNRPSLHVCLFRYNIRDTILKNFETSVNNQSDLKIIHLLINILGVLMPTAAEIDQIIQSCIKRNDLKGLIIFTSRLLIVDRHDLNKWILYSLYTLVAKTERRHEIAEQMLASTREKQFVEKNAGHAEILTVLSLLPECCKNVDDKGDLVGEALQILIESKVTDKGRTATQSRKEVSEAISCLTKALKEDIICELDFNNILCSLLVACKDNDMHFMELLSIARDYWFNSSLGNSYKNIKEAAKAIETLEELFVHRDFTPAIDEEDNDVGRGQVDVLESLFDATFVLTDFPIFWKSKSLSESIDRLWNAYHQEKWFISASMALLLKICAVSDAGGFSKILGGNLRTTLPELMCECLKDPFLAPCVVSALDVDWNIDTQNCLYPDVKSKDRHSLVLTRFGDEAYWKLISSLCVASLRAIDSGLTNDILQYINSTVMCCITKIDQLYCTGILHTTRYILQSDLYTSALLRKTAITLYASIRKSLKSMKANTLRTDLKQLTKPCFVTESKPAEVTEPTIEKPLTNDTKSREEKLCVIDRMFPNISEYSTAPILDYIEELNSRLNDDVNHDEESLPQIPLDLDRLCAFYTSEEKDFEENVNFSTGILDDILAAKDTKNAAPMDCY